LDSSLSGLFQAEVIAIDLGLAVKVKVGLGHVESREKEVGLTERRCRPQPPKGPTTGRMLR